MAQIRRSTSSFSAERARHRQSRRRKPGRSRFSLSLRLSSIAIGILIALVMWAIIARVIAPRSNTDRQSFDAIVILGTPADSDGNPTPALLDRVTEGVHEYERGVAPRLIVTGAAAHNRFVEADVMAGVARSQGVPASAILEEPQALDTIQNACYSTRILKAHGWHSVEVISSAAHLPRAAMIFSHLPVDFQVHAAPADLAPSYYETAATVIETLKTARYLVWSRWTESCSP